MLVKLDAYDMGRKIVSLAKDEETVDRLILYKLNALRIIDDKVVFIPEGKEYKIKYNGLDRLKGCCNFDVFQIDEQGGAFRYYSGESNDNLIYVTNKCNSNCIMCPIPESERRLNSAVSVDETINIIKYMPTDARHITITGGEPFTVGKDMFRILDVASKHFEHCEFLLLTNGRIFSVPEYVYEFQRCTPANIIVGIPIHGYNSLTHDGIVQANGAFEQTLQGIKNLLRKGFRIEIRIVVSKLNYRFITEIAKLIVDEIPKIESVKIMGLEMLGNAAKNAETVWIPYSEAFKASVIGIDMLIKAGIDTAVYNFPLCFIDDKYRMIAKKSISDYKIRYSEKCNGCKLMKECGGIFAGTMRLTCDDVCPQV